MGIENQKKSIKFLIVIMFKKIYFQCFRIQNENFVCKKLIFISINENSL